MKKVILEVVKEAKKVMRKIYVRIALKKQKKIIKKKK